MTSGYLEIFFLFSHHYIFLKSFYPGYSFLLNQLHFCRVYFFYFTQNCGYSGKNSYALYNPPSFQMSQKKYKNVYIKTPIEVKYKKKK